MNQGTKGGDSGLDDYKYETYDVEDELDFMRGIERLPGQAASFGSERDAPARREPRRFSLKNERTNEPYEPPRTTANHREPPLCTAYVR